MQKLSSDEISEQQQGKLLADELLKEKTSVDENEELKVTSSRTVINKILEKDERSPDEMSRGNAEILNNFFTNKTLRLISLINFRHVHEIYRRGRKTKNGR